MSTRTLFPYRSFLGGVEVELLSGPSGFHVDAGNRRLVAAEELQGLIEITFQLKAPVFELSSCLPAGSLFETHLELGMRAIAKASRFRRLYREVSKMKILDGWVTNEISIVLDASECRGKIEFEPVVLLAQEVEPNRRTEGLAYAKSSVIANGEEWLVILDLDEPPPGKGLPIKWVPFTTRFPESPSCHTNLFAVEPEPCIILNSEIDGLHETLHSKATTGPIARVRDMVMHQIVLQSWSSLIGSAVAAYVAVTRDNPDATPMEILEEIDSWKSAVVKEWAPYLARNAAQDDALELIHDRIIEGADLMLDEVPTAIQSRFETFKSFNGMMVEFGDKLRGDSDD